MYVIVPLAGPDFCLENGRTKANEPYKDGELLQVILDSRCWSREVPNSNYIFILNDNSTARGFSENYLNALRPGCKVVFLSNYARGAALSALAGVSLIENMNDPLIIDLGDIDYKVDLDVRTYFSEQNTCGAIGLTFESNLDRYSYLQFDDDGKFELAREKSVISSNASAGTYIFRSAEAYLKALGNNLAQEAEVTYRNLFYVCPVFNGIKDEGMEVHMINVSDVIDVK